MLSINQAAKRGITRLREPRWADPMDHIKIDLIGDCPGPWIHLYCPINKEINGRDPVDVLDVGLDYTAEEFEEYSGPLPDSDEYKTRQAAIDTMMKGN